MTTFLHDLPDKCPDCGLPLADCTCDKDYPTRTYILYPMDDDEFECIGGWDGYDFEDNEEDDN